jgi:hypothetical protein
MQTQSSENENPATETPEATGADSAEPEQKVNGEAELAERRAIRKLFKSLPCPLPDLELIKMGSDLASLNLEIAELQEEKKEIAKSFTTRIDGKQETAAGLARRLKDGKGWREVECQDVLIPETNLVETVRMDTGDVVGTRVALDADLQLKLFEEEDRTGETEGDTAPANVNPEADQSAENVVLFFGESDQTEAEPAEV